MLHNILAGYLVILFQYMFDQGKLPRKWGTALLTLVFKSGCTSNWSDYRPIAVTQVIAKVYGLVLNQRLNTWAEAEGIRCPAQTGFRAQYSTHMNTFTLLHLIDKYKQLKKPVFCCFVDLKKAYDSVIRSHVWQRLYSIGVRGKMLHALSAFYHNVTCVIKFRNGTSQPFATNVGVRQGCPLSPFIFGVFVELLHDLVMDSVPDAGVVIEVGGRRCLVPVMMFADDLTKLAERAAKLQAQLNVLAKFCSDEDMSLSFAKTKIVVFNASFQSAADRAFKFMFNGTELQRAKEYKFLGALMRQGSIVSSMMQHAARRGQSAIAITYKKFHQLGVASNIDIMLRLFNAVAMPNLTFGCEVWGPWALQCDMVEKPSQNVVEQVRLSFLRVLLALKSSTPAWCMFREVGMYPLQIFVARQLVRFINKLWNMPESTLARQAMLEAWVLYRACEQDNWCARLDMFMSHMGIQPSECVHGGMLPIYVDSDVELQLRHKCHSVFLSPGLPSKLASYHTQFAVDIPLLQGTRQRGWPRALYLSLPIRADRLRLLARFRMSCHHLAVETGRWRGVLIDERKCDLCDMDTVQDEHHVLFVCPALEFARLQLPRLFGSNRFTYVQKLFHVNPHTEQDWQLIVRDTCRYLELVGGIYKPISAP